MYTLYIGLCICECKEVYTNMCMFSQTFAIKYFNGMYFYVVEKSIKVLSVPLCFFFFIFYFFFFLFFIYEIYNLLSILRVFSKFVDSIDFVGVAGQYRFTLYS
jgi:hypothetical protein